jgi:transposase InsO family protein
MQTKITRKPFPKIDRSSNLLQLVHSDVCDMYSNPTRGGKKYFITFINDFSKYCCVYLMFSKDEVLKNFKVYKTEVENQYDVRIKCLRSDRGGEYYFPSYCESVGIIHETSIAYNPQQNGVVERKNRTLVEMVNALLCNSGLNKIFWGEAILSACYILNRLLHTNYGRKENPTLVILRCGGVELLSDYLSQKSRNLDKKLLSAFSWVMHNIVKVIGS